MDRSRELEILLRIALVVGAMVWGGVVGSIVALGVVIATGGCAC